MADDSTDDTGAQDLGESLVRRAAAPGVIGHDVAARLQRRGLGGGALGDGLAAEIQRRWSPAGSSGAWDAGPGLVHPAGFGGVGGAAMGSAGGSVQAMPVARTVGAAAAGAAAGPAIQALPGGGGGVVRRSVAGSPSSSPSPVLSVTSGRPLGIGAHLSGAGDSSPLGGGGLEQGGGQEGGDPNSHKRLAPKVLPGGGAPLLTSPLSQPPPSQGGGTPRPHLQLAPMEPLVQRVSAPPSLPSGVEMGPAIVHRAAGRGPVQRASLAPGGAGLPLPLAPPAQAPQAPEAAAPVQRASVSPISPISPIGQIRPSGPISSASPAAPTAPAAALPLVQARRAAVAPGGRGDRAPGDVLIQRQPAESVFGASDKAAAATPDNSSAGGAVTAGETGTAAAGFDLEDVVESVMRRLTRSLAVENERHGGRRWP